MDKEQQDLVWQCLPKEVRDKIKGLYVGLDSALNAILSKEALSNEECNRVRAIKDKKAIYERYFGRNNLTSDTEPSELLFVEKEKVQEVYKTSQEIVENETYGSKMYSMHLQIMYVLESLFGNKCLPDTEPSVQSEPKFKFNIGDLVTYRGKVKKVIDRELYWDGAIMYTCSLINGQSPLRFEEECLKPYTEPETKL